MIRPYKFQNSRNGCELTGFKNLTMDDFVLN